MKGLVVCVTVRYLSLWWWDCSVCAGNVVYRAACLLPAHSDLLSAAGTHTLSSRNSAGGKLHHPLASPTLPGRSPPHRSYSALRTV